MKKSKGITLIELIIAMAIMAIVLMTGLPALNNTMKDNRLISVYNQITSLAALARAEAGKRNSSSINITLCKSSDSKTCANSTGGFNFIVFVNLNGDGNVDTADTLLKSIPIANKDIKINLTGFANNQIHFLAGGTPDKTGSLMICDDRGNAHTKGMIMNISGQLRQAQAGETSCS